MVERHGRAPKLPTIYWILQQPPSSPASARPLPQPGVISSATRISIAMERIVGKWDSYAYTRGKNMFAYKPQSSRWELLPWDIDFVFSSGDALGARRGS